MKNHMKNAAKRILRIVSPAYRVALRNEEKMERLHTAILQTHRSYGNLRRQIDQYAYRDQMMFWWSMSDGEHSLKEIQEEFYRRLPAAEGGTRIMQLGGLYLLQNFREICGKAGLNFWLIGGTLLGAVRHGGFIPWDDDIDVAMMQEDFKKLEEILQSSDKFMLKRDFCQKAGLSCIKFRLRNEDSPFFIDVMLNDFAGCGSQTVEEMNRAIEQLRSRTNERLRNLNLLQTYAWQPLNDEDAAVVSNAIRECREELPSAAARDYIYRSIEIISPPAFKSLLPADVIFPLAQLTFEGQAYPVPGAWDEYLRKQYGNYYLIPGDCYNHHVQLYCDKLANGAGVLKEMGIIIDDEESL